VVTSELVIFKKDIKIFFTCFLTMSLGLMHMQVNQHLVALDNHYLEIPS
jgi:hypothetical protein